MKVSNRKKLLFLTSRLPFPPISGRKKVLYEHCLYLGENAGFSVTVASLPEGDTRLFTAVPPFLDAVHVLGEPSRREVAWRLTVDSLLRQRYPLQVSLYRSAELARAVKRLLAEVSPDVVIADMVRTAWYFMDMPLTVPRILDLDDLLSIRYRRQLEAGCLDSPYGRLKERLPAGLRRLADSHALNRWVLQREVKVLERFEREAARAYEATVVVSPVEATILQKHVGPGRVFAIPPSVGAGLLNREVKQPEKHMIAFLGAMDVAHNEAAVVYFCEQIFPLLKDRFPDVRFMIIGDRPTARVKQLAHEPGVIVTGWVEDPYVYLASAAVCVAPLTFGSGIKTKILEAMAVGVPVVTTSIGAEGIGATPGEHLFIGDTPQDFALAVERLLLDDDLRSWCRQRAREFVAKSYAFDVVMARWNDVLRAVGIL